MAQVHVAVIEKNSPLLNTSLITETAPKKSGLWHKALDELKTVYTQGDDEVWFSGIAYHGRNSYTPEKIATLNEWAWGLGWGKSIHTKQSHRGVFGLAMLDSHKDMQYQLGYSYEKPFYFNQGSNNKANPYIAMGLIAGIVRREDMFKKTPFPAIFPLMSVGYQTAQLRFIYIPRLSNNLGNGDVLYVFSSIKF